MGKVFESCSHHLCRVYLLATAPSALWLAWITHNPGKEPAFVITDSMKFLHDWGQKLVAPEGYRCHWDFAVPRWFKNSWTGEREKSNASHFRLLVSGVTSCLICAPKNLITALFWRIQMMCRVSCTSFYVCFPYAWGLCSIKTEITYLELRRYPPCVPVQHCSCHTISTQSLILWAYEDVISPPVKACGKGDSTNTVSRLSCCIICFIIKLDMVSSNKVALRCTFFLDSDSLK